MYLVEFPRADFAQEQRRVDLGEQTGLVPFDGTQAYQHGVGVFLLSEEGLGLVACLEVVLVGQQPRELLRQAVTLQASVEPDGSFVIFHVGGDRGLVTAVHVNVGFCAFRLQPVQALDEIPVAAHSLELTVILQIVFTVYESINK